ncbi:hypothetical protein GBN14_08500 [Plesiomonas shigelloides]|nr:hypothetical protein GBN14_08500 [Plesiomonas shigelloides]
MARFLSSVFCLLSSVFCLLSSVFCLLSSVLSGMANQQQIGLVALSGVFCRMMPIGCRQASPAKALLQGGELGEAKIKCGGIGFDDRLR